MSSIIAGIIFPTSPDKWAYAKQQEDLAKSIAARISMAEAKATRESEAAMRYVDHVAKSEFGGRSAYDIAVANGFVGSESEWLESLKGAKGDPGVAGNEQVTAPTVASFITSDTAVKRELDKTYKRGFSVKEFGAVGNGVADDTAAIQACADAAFRSSPSATVYFPEGRYKTTDTIRIRCALDGKNGQIEYYGSGTALLVGTDEGVIVTSRIQVYLPRIINRTATTAKAFDGTSIGARLVNLSTCQINFEFIQNFEYGLVCEGYGQGFVHNTLYVGSLWNNHVNLSLRPVTANGVNGWVNSNLFLGGRFSADPTWGQVDDPDAFYIEMKANPAGVGPNANTFVGASIEGTNLQYYRLKVTGSYNHFYNCRWEHPTTDTIRILWDNHAYYNRVVGGYNFWRVAEDWAEKSGSNVAQLDEAATEARSFTVVAADVPHDTATPVQWTSFNGFRTTYKDGTVSPRPGRWQIDVSLAVMPTVIGGYAEVQLLDGTGKMIAVTRCAGSSLNTSQLTTLRVSARRMFKPGETFSVVVRQTTGGVLKILGSAYYSQIQMEMIG